ncbi:unnamed protein product [Trichobilharzia regenti]|nr:unnamed protein product [Trichobilharzia regenti]
MKDVPLRTGDNMTTDEEIDIECVNSGVSQFFYRNLTTCTLGQYAQIPNDTDMLRSVNTPESIRACYVSFIKAAIIKPEFTKSTQLIY